jgi:hypothetical protein
MARPEPPKARGQTIRETLRDRLAPPGEAPPQAGRGRFWPIAGAMAGGIWLLLALAYLLLVVGRAGLEALPPAGIAEVVIAAVLPSLLLWLLALFVERGSELRRHARALESRLAELTYPAAQSEENVRRIGQSLEAQARRLSEATGSAVRQLETVMQDATARAESAAAALRAGGEALSHAAGEAEARIGRLVERLDGHAQAIDATGEAIARRDAELGALLAERLALLQRTAGETAMQAQALADTLDAQCGRLASSAAAAGKQGRDLGQGLQALIDRLDSAIGTLVIRAGELDRLVAEDTARIEATARLLAGQAERIETELRGHDARVAEMAHSVTGAIDDAGALFATRAGELDGAAAAAQARIEASSRGFVDAADRISSRGEAAAQALDGAGERLAAQQQAIADAARGGAEEVVRASGALQQGMEVLESLAARTNAALASLRTQEHEIMQAADRVGEAIRETTAALQTGRQGLADDAFGLDEMLRQAHGGFAAAEAALGRQGDAVAAAMTRARAEAERLHRAFEASQAGFAAGAEAAQRFGQEANRLTDTAEAAAARVAGAGGRLRQASLDLGDVGDSQVRRMAAGIEALAAGINGVRGQAEAAEAALRRGAGSLAAESDGVAAAAADAESRIGEMRRRLVSDAEALRSHTEALGAGLAEALGALGGMRPTLAHLVEALADARADAGRQLGAFRAVAEQTAAGLQQVDAALAARAAEATAAGAERAATLGAAASALMRHRELLLAGIDAADARLAAQAERAAAALQGNAEAAERSAGRLGAAIASLAETAAADTGRLAELQASAEIRLRALSQAAVDEVARAEAATGTLIEEQRALRAMLDETLARIGEAGHMLARHTEALAAGAATADTAMVEAGISADTEVERLTELIGALQVQSGNLVDRLRGQIEQLGTTSERVLAVAGLAGRDFDRQAAHLIETAERAQAQAARLRQETDQHESRDLVATLSSITSSLTALGVDLTRAYERNVPDDAWQRYLAGDRAIFVRRLLQRPELHSLDSIRSQYRDSGDFRAQVDRYLERFEALLRQTREHDRERLVSATYLSSDVGKLYLLLARALDRIN